MDPMDPMALSELLWSLRSSVAAVELRLELLRRTWPRSPPEWLEEEEVRDLLRPYLESSQLPLLLQLLHSAPIAWRDASTRTRTRTLLALVEPCDVHLLRVRLDVICGLSPEMCPGRCHLRLRLAKAGSWMESSSFCLAVPPFPSGPCCFLDDEFQFSIPVSSGDSVLSLFGPGAPGASGLEVQMVDEDGRPLLQGELSPAEFLAYLERPGASCIKLESAESFQRTGLKSCSVAGVMAGPQLQMELRCSQMAAPLDALPYWAVPPTVATRRAIPEVTMEEASGATDLAPQTETVTMEEASGATDLAPQTETVTMEEASGATDLAPQTETVTTEEASGAADLAHQTETVTMEEASGATDLAPQTETVEAVTPASGLTACKAELEDLEPWLQGASPRALLSRVVETAQLAVDMVAGLGQPLETTVPADVAPSAMVAAKDSKDDLDITVSSLDLRADSKAQALSARRVQRCVSAEDEPEPAAEEFLELEPMGGAVAAPPYPESSAAALPKHDMAPLFTPGTGAGVPPPKSAEPESLPATPVQAWQLGGRGPLPPDLVREPMAAISATGASNSLPRDLSPAVPAEPKTEVVMTAVQTAGPTRPEIQSPEPEELPMVSFRRRATSPVSPASPVWEVENETTLTSRLDGWGATRSPPRWPQKPRWAGTWTSSPSVPSPQRLPGSGLGSTRSTMTPRQRLEDLAADGPKGGPQTPPRESRNSLASPARWSERLDVNTKRLAKILRSCAVDESSDSS